ncbi:MAG: Rieske 2Fe-2S domain-containing protein [Myxococcota bacterium]
MNRRHFCAGCAAMSACAPVDPVWLTDDDSGSPNPATPTEPGACDDPAPTGPERLALSLSDYPELAKRGGFVGIATSVGEVIVARVETDCVIAMRRACTHEGVPINYIPGREQFVCPRHAAVYDWNGEKVSGPQPRGLPTYPAGIDGDTVYVDVS